MNLTMRNLGASLGTFVGWIGMCSLVTAGTIYVDATNCPGGDGSQGNPFCTIQQGIDAAVNGDEVLVMPGTYFEQIDFKGKDIRVFSDQGPEVTIIDCQSVDNSTGVSFVTQETANAIFEGFTVRKCWNGIRCIGSSPTILSNTITRNSSQNENYSETVNGGGIFCDGAAPQIECNTISANLAVSGAGIACLNGSPAIIRNNTIANNTARGLRPVEFVAGAGGGIYCLGSSPTIEGNDIYSNFAGNDESGYGGGIALWDGSDAFVIDNWIDSNTAYGSNSSPAGGGVDSKNSAPILINDTITENSSSGFPDFAYGGGVSLRTSSAATLLNTTIASNDACGLTSADGGGVFVDPTSVATITNSILYYDTPNETFGPVNVTYSNLQNWPGGGNNIASPPKFLDAVNDDYRLACDSPCIDAGTNTPPGGGLPALDFEGDDRNVDGDSSGGAVVDMGADEFDALFRFNGPAKVGQTFSFTVMAPPAEAGNTALVLFSLGNGKETGGIPVPVSGGQRLMLDFDPVFSLWLNATSAFAVTISGCPGGDTPGILTQLPGFKMYYAGVTIGGGVFVSVTPTHSFLTIP